MPVEGSPCSVGPVSCSRCCCSCCERSAARVSLLSAPPPAAPAGSSSFFSSSCSFALHSLAAVFSATVFSVGDPLSPVACFSPDPVRCLFRRAPALGALVSVTATAVPGAAGSGVAALTGVVTFVASAAAAAAAASASSAAAATQSVPSTCPSAQTALALSTYGSACRAGTVLGVALTDDDDDDVDGMMILSGGTFGDGGRPSPSTATGDSDDTDTHLRSSTLTSSWHLVGGGVRDMSPAVDTSGSDIRRDVVSL